jgi:hypothetical protein
MQGGTGDCTSWGDACDLQAALAAAASSDEIWAAAGVYQPTADPAAADPRTATFHLKSGVAVYGGFAGTETSRDERNPAANVTILSGDLNGDDGANFANNSENSYHVVIGANNAILDGVTITAGNANQATTTGIVHNRGGGMYNHYSSPTLTNVTFYGNRADGVGGGMYNRSGSPTLNNVTFSGNSTLNYGGGMGNQENSSPTLNNVTFSDNWSDFYYGGGMYNHYSSPTLNNVTFSGNTAGTGGGMSNWVSSPTLTNVTFSGNMASSGGGMHNHSTSNPTLTNVTFSGNSAGNSGNGGGMHNQTSSNPTLTNVTFSGNTAGTFGTGGGMTNWSSNPTLTNVTFSGNSVGTYGTGGGMCNQTSNPTLTNVILWGNSAPNGPQIHSVDSTPNVTYSIVQGGHAGTGNIDADPLFVDSANGNLRLGFGSPAIDAGNNSAVPAGVTTDLDGLPRFADGNADGTATVDMGVYEAGQMVCNMAAGNAYPFASQSTDVSIYVGTLGSELACLYVDEMRIDHPNAGNAQQTGRYWLIRGLQSDKSTAATGYEARLTLPHSLADPSKASVCRYTGSGWDCWCTGYNATTVWREEIDAFSDWAVGNDAPLAVTLATFEAVQTAEGVMVFWETASELGTVGYNLYRSATAAQPETWLAYLPSQAPGSTSGFSYSYLDTAVQAGETYWYWLEDVDVYGVTTLHGPVSATLGGPTAVHLAQFDASSRPASPAAWLLALLAMSIAGWTMQRLQVHDLGRRRDTRHLPHPHLVGSGRHRDRRL